MPEPQPQTRVDRWVDRKLSSRALRPRYAARLIAAIWLVAVVLFGVIERIVDPETFDSIWLAFWWALQTITTVGYGDVVPGQADGKAIGAVLMLGGSVVAVDHHGHDHQRVHRPPPGRDAGVRRGPGMRQLQQIESRLDGIDAELRRLEPARTRSS